MVMKKKLNAFFIDGIIAYPSKVKDSEGRDLVLTKQILQESIKYADSSIFLYDRHPDGNSEDAPVPIGIINTLNYDEDEDVVKFSGLAFDEKAQKMILSGEYGISPEIFTNGGSEDKPERIDIYGAALAANPKMSDTKIEGRWIYMSEEDGGKEAVTEVDNIIKTVDSKDSKVDVATEFAKEHLKAHMKSNESKIAKLTKERDEYKSQIEALQAEKTQISEKYNSVIGIEVKKVENTLKELGYKDPSKLASEVDGELRLKILNEFVENHVKSASVQQPLEKEIEPQDKPVDLKKYAEEMGFSEDYTKYL